MNKTQLQKTKKKTNLIDEDIDLGRFFELATAN